VDSPRSVRDSGNAIFVEPIVGQTDLSIARPLAHGSFRTAGGLVQKRGKALVAVMAGLVPAIHV
jgi:hypothetical protein